MKKVLAVLVMALALPLVVQAGPIAPAPCPVSGSTTSFADYMNMQGGCTVGDKVFTDFDYFSGGTNALDASEITVHPDNTNPLNPGLIFTGVWRAADGATSDSHIQFTISTLSGEPLIEDASLSISGYGTENGSVTVGENLCLGGLFDGWTTDCSGNATRNLLVDTGLGVTFAHTTFTPVSTVDVFKDIGLSSDRCQEVGCSVAFVSGVTNHFSQVPVPEPATLTLLGTGLLAIGGKLRRMNRRKKSS